MILANRLFSLKLVTVQLAAALFAGCAAPHAPSGDIDSVADSTLRQMCDLLDGSKSFRLTVHATMDGRAESGQLVQFNRASDISITRPDRLYAKTDSNEGKWSVWYQNRSLTVLDRESNEYATEAVPGRIDEMLDYLAENHDLCMPMADLLVGKTYDSLLADVEEGTYLGLHLAGDTKCHHLLFRQENIDWQIWIDSGAKPLPRKMVITYTQQPDQPQYVATMDNWDLAPALPSDTFTFAPPADAKSIALEDLIHED
jgi:hypothetical protein